MGEGALVDRLAIEDLASLVDRMVDDKQWQQLSDCFADPLMVDLGAVADAAPVELSRQTFIRELAAINPPDKRTGHSRSNSITRIDGDEAVMSACSYGWNQCARFDPPVYEVWGTMEYGFSRIEGTWRITRLSLRKRREAGNPDVNAYRA